VDTRFIAPALSSFQNCTVTHEMSDLTDLIEAFKSASTPVISDNLDRAVGAVGVRPFHNLAEPMVGRALTVKTRSGDNAAIHRALRLIAAGDVLVVDGGGDISRALFGEIMATIAKTRGAAGVVIDGAIRDSGAISASNFPCFARAAHHRGPYKNGPGEINVPVCIGGMLVNPGDIVVGDADGVVAFPTDVARTLLSDVQTQLKREQQILKSIADGTYIDAYGN
jgi:RraA family protein